MDDPELERLIAGSGLFDPTWYAARNPDVGWTALDPSVHFRRYGLPLNRDPGPDFDARLYLAAHADVAAAGVAPFLHYLRHGRAEGRVCNPAQKLAADAVDSLAAHLWGGREDAAPGLLRAIMDDWAAWPGARFAAAVHLAVWTDFCGDAETALSLLDTAGSLSPVQAGHSSLTIRRALLLHRLGHADAARAAIAATDPGLSGTADVCLVRATVAGDPAETLAALNAIWTAAGLANVAMTGPAGFAGLDAASSAQPAPDVGTVSVIVPAHDAASTLPFALRALMAQSYRNLDILVVDDASRDDTAAVAARHAAADPRIRLIRSDQNLGPYGARNLGLAAARGAFVTTHDADDWSHPQKIALQLAALIGDPSVAGTLSDWIRVHPDLTVSPGWRLNDDIVHWSHPSFLFRREAAGAAGWDEVRVGADTELIWRIEARLGEAAVRRVLPGVPLALALESPGSLTRTARTHARSLYHGLRHYYREICRFRHRQGTADDDRTGRWRKMLPEEMVRRDAPAPEVDRIVIGDCRLPAHVQRMREQLRPGHRLGVAHRPEIAVPARLADLGVRFCDAFFALVEQPDVVILLPDQIDPRVPTVTLGGD
ncbi:MAG: glycosyltransferase family 2 protein [Gemmobacter sp.]